MYLWENNMLVMRKVDVPNLDMNVMSDLQQSYSKYLTETIHYDAEYMQELLRAKVGGQYHDVTVSVRVGDLVQQLHTRSQVSSGIYYYPVFATFKSGNYTIASDVEILRVPYIDDYGRVNCNGNPKVILSVQRSSDDLSYDVKKGILNISMPNMQLKIVYTDKGVFLHHGSMKVPLERLISAMLHDMGDDRTKVSDLFSNTFIKNAMKATELTINKHAYAYLTNMGMPGKLKTPLYKLGLTREALNATFSYDCAIGRRLSRKTLGHPIGTVITKAMTIQFYKAMLPVVHVFCDGDVPDYVFGQDYALSFARIPAGTLNGALLRKSLPAYADLDRIPEDVMLPKPIYFNTNDAVTSECVEFLTAIGYLNIQVKTAPESKKVFQYSLETEIASNNMARLGDLVSQIPDGRSADEWVYLHNNSKYAPTCNDYMTPHDFIAIMSTLGRIRATGVVTILDRDTAFLKKVLLVGDILSESLRKTLDTFIGDYKTSIIKFLDARSAVQKNPFAIMTDKWLSLLNNNKYTAPLDTTNLMAEISQSIHVNTITSKAQQTPDALRYLSMPYFGRICPFETPASGKLGLVNTKAMGAKIENGLLKTPYRKVLASSNGGIRISNKITYLSVKEEIGKKFGDILTFKKDKYGNYINAPIVAKIPNPENDENPFIFATINTFDLAGGYVLAHPEQFLSPVAATIPFASSTDPVRISYGLSQLKQSIYVHRSERPLVTTSMYRDMFKYSTESEYKSPCNGLVRSASGNRVVIAAHDGDKTVTIDSGAKTTGQLDSVIDILVKTGDSVREGDVIARVLKYPQYFVVRAPYRCKIIDITNQEIQISRMSETSSTGGPVNLDNCDRILIENVRIAGHTATFLNLHVSVGDVVEKGDIIATTGMSTDGEYSPSRNALVAFIMDGYNHEDGISSCMLSSYNYTSLISHSISAKVPYEKYTNAYARNVSGFKYCGDNDIVGTLTVQHKNGTEPDVKATRTDFKHKGIPYECVRKDKDSAMRTYSWHMLDFKPLKQSDKMAGCHGNKGVVSVTHNNSDMPLLMNGRQVEFMLNPCGVPSRMNLGQILSVHLGLAAHVLGVQMCSDAYNGATSEEVELLLQFAHKVANTPNINNDRGVFDTVCSLYPQFPKEFYEQVWRNIDNAVDWAGAFNPDGTARLYDPTTGTYFENNVTIGFMYLNKLMQEGEEKITFRSGPLSHDYSRTTSQPMKSDHSSQGQRIAEMELIALAAYGADNLIDECYSLKSDNIAARVNAHMKQLGLDESFSVPQSCDSPRSLETLLYMLEAMGVYVEMPKELCDTSYSNSQLKHTLDIRKIARVYMSTQETDASQEQVDDISSLQSIAGT